MSTEAGGGERAYHHGNEPEDDDVSVDQSFQEETVPSWTEQLTFRAFVVSVILGIFLTFIILKLSLSTGFVPAFNISAGLLGFFLVKMWTKAIGNLGFSTRPFTRQENTVIQTCVVSCTGIGFSGGFGSYILAMTDKLADEIRDPTKHNNIKNPKNGWMISFLLMTNFIGLFTILPLARMMIIKQRLPYPTGTAVAHLINNFHTPQGIVLARKQVWLLFKTCFASFTWAAFSWLFSGGNKCGIWTFPLFGMAAKKSKFYFDFELSNIAMGMICSHMVNFSLLCGAIFSWGFLWPHIASKEGDWYPANIDKSSVQGLLGYKVFISVAMILGDGFFHLLDVLLQSLYDLYVKRWRSRFVLPKEAAPAMSSVETTVAADQEERIRTNIFLQEQIPIQFAIGGYLLCGTIAAVGIPNMFPQLKTYHIVATYVLAPMLGFCNAYGSGLTNWSMGPTYGKFAIILFSGWVGAEAGGVLAGLAACGMVLAVVNTASDLMQDFRTCYLTMSSPRAMFIGQILGTALGCVLSPLVFSVVYESMPIGQDNAAFAAPYAKVYRAMSLLSTEGISKLPKHCVALCMGFFAAAILVNVLRAWLKSKGWRMYQYIPNPMGMAIPFYLGGYFAISMCVGSTVVWLWTLRDGRRAAVLVPVVASGLLCGESLWFLPSTLLSLYDQHPPFCFRVLSADDNDLLTSYLTFLYRTRGPAI